MLRKTIVSYSSEQCRARAGQGGVGGYKKPKLTQWSECKMSRRPQPTGSEWSSPLSLQIQHYGWVRGLQSCADFSPGSRSHRQDTNPATSAPHGLCPRERSPTWQWKPCTAQDTQAGPTGGACLAAAHPGRDGKQGWHGASYGAWHRGGSKYF